MESALDVLSRAASMVETGSKEADQEHLYKSSSPTPQILECRESPCRELPTKALKLERAKERLELSQPLHFNKNHASRYSRRCAGTQTQVTSVSQEMYRNGDTIPQTTDLPPTYTSLYHQRFLSFAQNGSQHQQSEQHQQQQQQQQHQNCSQPSSTRFASLDSHEAPLNLSLTNLSSARASPTQSRPSVITCALSTSSTTSNGRYENSSGCTETHSQKEVISADTVCDPDIEEHFRRSLGRQYLDFLGKHPVPTHSPPAYPQSPPHHPPPLAIPPPPPPQHFQGLPPLPATSLLSTLPPPSSSLSQSPVLNTTTVSSDPNVSITGCVDDHFAKSLGDRTWSALQEKDDQSPGSVDDHFAKALGGETWLRIKAGKEGSQSQSEPSHQLTPQPPSAPTCPLPGYQMTLSRSQQQSGSSQSQHSTSLLPT